MHVLMGFAVVCALLVSWAAPALGGLPGQPTWDAGDDAMAVVAVVKPSLVEVSTPIAVQSSDRPASAFAIPPEEKAAVSVVEPETGDETREHRERLRFFRSSPTRAGPSLA